MTASLADENPSLQTGHLAGVLAKKASDEACPRDGHDHSSLYFTATSDFWRTVMTSYLGDQGMKDRVDGSEDVGRAALATGYNVDQQPAQADASMTAQANFFSRERETERERERDQTHTTPCA